MANPRDFHSRNRGSIPRVSTTIREVHRTCNAYCRDGMHAHLCTIERSFIGDMSDDELLHSRLLQVHTFGHYSDVEDIVSIRRSHEARSSGTTYHPLRGFTRVKEETCTYLVHFTIKGESRADATGEGEYHR